MPRRPCRPWRREARHAREASASAWPPPGLRPRANQLTLLQIPCQMGSGGARTHFQRGGGSHLVGADGRPRPAPPCRGAIWRR